MKPGATILPVASIVLAPFSGVLLTSCNAAIFDTDIGNIVIPCFRVDDPATRDDKIIVLG